MGGVVFGVQSSTRDVADCVGTNQGTPGAAPKHPMLADVVTCRHTTSLSSSRSKWSRKAQLWTTGSPPTATSYTRAVSTSLR